MLLLPVKLRYIRYVRHIDPCAPRLTRNPTMRLTLFKGQSTEHRETIFPIPVPAWMVAALASPRYTLTMSTMTSTSVVPLVKRSR